MKLEPKFHIGQYVFMFTVNTMVFSQIKSITVLESEGGITYSYACRPHHYAKEKNIYSTVSEAIKSLEERGPLE